ncbi:hypothetical protein [Fibrobacter sp. UWEL]|uniref:hypothetical protein n=1 Tax=Fibrobacter sp. UWEL TaxID=1896209 RepID=UPI000921C610|nr:hypothetical protein [Fibrobacter sp. UWEL]SHK62522.1 hypothetical protein SAMN05720468_10490 [Fibrobacter sp. UWEL]
MPWYGDYAMESWANDNTAETWKTVMNNDYIITLEDMPGWDKYEIDENIIVDRISTPQNSGASVLKNKKNTSVFDLNGKQVKKGTSMQNRMFIVK